MSAPATEPLDWKPVPLAGPVTLRGHAVTLEPLNAERHAAALWQSLRGHDELWSWLPFGPFATESDLRRHIEERQAAAGFVFLAIVPAATGLAEGWASYMRMEPAHGVIEVGYVLFAPSMQRTAAATEAMFLMASHVFDQLGYRRYVWKCNAENLPSRRAAERLGFTFEGIFRQHMIVKGRNRETAWFSMLDREWPARKRAFESWLAPENFDGEDRQRRSLEQFRAARP